MKALFAALFVITALTTYAQEEIVQSVYFDSNKSSITEKQAQDIVNFVKKTDSTRVESVQIFGYCDDVGKEDYNKKLSNERAAAVKKAFIDNGITSKIIVTIEGKGRILIDDDIVDNLPEVRSKNRRVDVVINLKPLPKVELQIPGVFSAFQKKHIVGDRVMLSDMLFERGSSVLTYKCKTELEKVAKYLLKNKNVRIEIQGHVCCTPPNQKEAIDRATKKRKLSHNRAESVYKYLVFKKIGKERMTFKGYGNTQPLGESPELDRRVELVVTKL
jgi:outer membrane protein OmpA-like peptidoglycan-associated protein